MITQLSPSELTTYFYTLERRLLEHRYRYYVLDESVLEDFVYDFLEKEYLKLGRELGLYCYIDDLVGFDPEDERCAEAARRVDSGTDSYSLWLEEMRPVWDKLGVPKALDAKKDEEN